MKTVGLRQAAADLARCVRDAQRDHVLLTRHGRPEAVIFGVRGYDLEDLYWARNAPLRSQVERSRRSRGRRYSIDQLRRPG